MLGVFGRGIMPLPTVRCSTLEKPSGLGRGSASLARVTNSTVALLGADARGGYRKGHSLQYNTILMSLP